MGQQPGCQLAGRRRQQRGPAAGRHLARFAAEAGGSWFAWNCSCNTGVVMARPTVEPHGSISTVAWRAGSGHKRRGEGRRLPIERCVAAAVAPCTLEASTCDQARQRVGWAADCFTCAQHGPLLTAWTATFELRLPPSICAWYPSQRSVQCVCRSVALTNDVAEPLMAPSVSHDIWYAARCRCRRWAAASPLPPSPLARIRRQAWRWPARYPRSRS